MHIKRYIEHLDYEIDDYIREESDGLSAQREKTLHILFENRKHAKEYMAEKNMHNGQSAVLGRQ